MNITQMQQIPIADRISYMRDRLRNRTVIWDAERAMITTEAYKATENMVPIIRRPTATLEVCKKMTVRVEDFELIVGNRGQHFMGGCRNPEWYGAGYIPYLIDDYTLEDDGLYHCPKTDGVDMAMSREDCDKLLGIADYWKDRMVPASARSWKPDCYEELDRTAVSTMGSLGLDLNEVPVGHLTPGHHNILAKGYKAIKNQAQDWLDTHKYDFMGENLNKYLFYKSAAIACDAAMIMVKRYGKQCLKKAAECIDAGRKAELEMMADGLMWISENTPRTFWEACQAVIMYQLFLYIDSTYAGISLGRFDQYTWPFLKADLEEGRLTLEQAQEIVDAFFLKANCFFEGGVGEMNKIGGIGNTYQHTTIGGCDPAAGKESSNPVTYLVLGTMYRLELHDPTISLRVNKDTPDDLWNYALEISKKIGGIPLFQNDDVIIPALMEELGFELEDARDYSLIGCQEIVGSGCDYPAPNGYHPPHASLFFNKIFTMAINDGCNPVNGGQSDIHTGYLYEMETFEDVKKAFHTLSEHFLKSFVSVMNYAEYVSQWVAPHAGLSISMTGCMEKGMDCTAGGCKYNSFGGTAPCLATLADSLTTIKYMVYDKKLCSAKELYDAVMANWEGHEVLRQQILNEVPHFGNDDPYADSIMRWVTDEYYNLCQQCFSKRSKKFKAGLYGATEHIFQGETTWATPDGRKMGEPLADASSPVQSRDTHGPTAVFNSELAGIDAKKFMDGIALNIRVHPTALQGRDGIAKWRELTKSYLERGGMEVQYNVVDNELLKEAQKHPEKYQNLVVRIAGYSAYFVELAESCQNDLISRHAHS